MKNLLIVVDMINGFINEGLLHDKKINDIIPACSKHIADFISEGQEIIAFCDAHSESSKEFRAFPPHCLQGSNESELVAPLKQFEDKMQLIFKNSTNGFFAPGFKPYKERLGDYNKILIVGCCSDICVLQLALSLQAYCNENNYDCEIQVDVAACETFEIDGHSRRDYNELAFNLMANAGITLLNR